MNLILQYKVLPQNVQSLLNHLELCLVWIFHSHLPEKKCSYKAMSCSSSLFESLIPFFIDSLLHRLEVCPIWICNSHLALKNCSYRVMSSSSPLFESLIPNCPERTGHTNPFSLEITEPISAKTGWCKLFHSLKTWKQLPPAAPAPLTHEKHGNHPTWLLPNCNKI